MRELAVRIRFTAHSLGNVRVRGGDGRFLLPRSTGEAVTFLATWHKANMGFAAQVLGRHQDEVGKILWDIHVDGQPGRDCWYRRYYVDGSRRRYSLHESFVPGQIVGFRCVVPPAISDDDLKQLMATAGQYKGLSPFKPGQFGFFVVESVGPMRAATEVTTGVRSTEPDRLAADRVPG